MRDQRGCGYSHYSFNSAPSHVKNRNMQIRTCLQPPSIPEHRISVHLFQSSERAHYFNCHRIETCHIYSQPLARAFPHAHARGRATIQGDRTNKAIYCICVMYIMQEYTQWAHIIASNIISSPRQAQFTKKRNVLAKVYILVSNNITRDTSSLSKEKK